VKSLAVLAVVLGLAACATPAARVTTPEPPVAAAPSTAAAAPPAPEPPRQADQLARVASELVELQNAVAKLMMSARQHDDQLMYLQRRLSDLESQARGRTAAPPALAPPPLSPPLPPPPGSAAPAPPRVTPPALPPPADKPLVDSGTSQPRSPKPQAPVAAVRPAPPAAPRTPTPAPAPPTGATASAADTLYQAGVAKYQAGDLDAAVVTLYEVVANFPGDPARERAQFLVGDIFLAQKDYRGAVAELESLIAAVPAGSRVPDALLKLGMAQRSLGDEARARRAWERLVKEHPNSAAARQARTLLRAAR
jgi:TolA-binding protein